MKYLILLFLVISLGVQSEETQKIEHIDKTSTQPEKEKKPKTADEICVELYQAWVLNKGIEAVCEYSPLLSMKMILVAKASCGNMMPAKRAEKLSGPVLIALRKDFTEMGKELFCEKARPGYEDLLDVIVNGK